VVGDDELWADFQQRLRQSKHNVTAADTRRMFQVFLTEKKKAAAEAAGADAAEQNSLNVGQGGEAGTSESLTAGTDVRRPPSSMVEAAAASAASTASSAKSLFRRMSMISTVSGGGSVRSINSSSHSSRQIAAAAAEDEDGNSRRGSLGSLGSLGALYNNIVGELSDSEDDDSDDEDLLGRMVGSLSSSPGRLGMLQKFSSDRGMSNPRPSSEAQEVQSNRCIYQMAQEVGNAAAGDTSIQPSSTLQSHGGQQNRRGSIAGRLAHVAALAKVSLEDEIDGEDDGHDNDGHGAYSGLR